MTDPLAALKLSFGAGRDRLTLHHVAGVAVELDHLADGHGGVRVNKPVLWRRHLVAHDRATHRRGRFVDRPLAGLATNCLARSVEDVASAAGEIRDAAGGKAVNMDLKVALRHRGDVLRADDVHAGGDGRAPTSGGQAFDLVDSDEAVAVGAAELHFGVEGSVALGDAQALCSGDLRTNNL